MILLTITDEQAAKTRHIFIFLKIENPSRGHKSDANATKAKLISFRKRCSLSGKSPLSSITTRTKITAEINQRTKCFGIKFISLVLIQRF